MKLERRFMPGRAELRAGEGDAPNKIVGLAAIFDTRSQNLGGFFEVIDAKAFDDTDFADVRGLFNHDPSYLLGRSTSGTLELNVSERGLEYTITPPDTAQARDVATLLARGDVDESSFAFYVAPNGRSWDEDNDTGQVISTVTKIQRVVDVGPVTYGAYTETSSALRGEANADLCAEYNDFLAQRGDNSAARKARLRFLSRKLDANLRGL